jgi:hypothetical protein
MDLRSDWKAEYNNEINQAIQARQSGKEGMARVCARRAAGIVIGEYLARHSHTNPTNSAFERLILFTQLPEVDQSYKIVAHHCLMKVNRKYELPLDSDLISEVIWLEKSLLFDNQN